MALRLRHNRLDLGALGSWSLAGCQDPRIPGEIDFEGPFSISEEYATLPLPLAFGERPARLVLGWPDAVDRRDSILLEVQAALLDICGVAVVFPHYFPGQETSLAGSFFPLAGPAEMPLLLAAVEAVKQSFACPHFSWVSLGRTARAMAAVQPTARSFNAATFSILFLSGQQGQKRNVRVPLSIQDILDQIFADRALLAAHPVALRDRRGVEGTLDGTPWGSEQVVLTFEGEEPDAYMLAEGLSQKVFKGPTGGVVRLDIGFAYQDRSGARHRMNQWWEIWRSRYPGAATSGAPVTFARMPRFAMPGVRQRLTDELAHERKIDGETGAPIRARAPLDHPPPLRSGHSSRGQLQLRQPAPRPQAPTPPTLQTERLIGL